MNSADFHKFKQDFINEAKILHQLRDIPNVVNVHDYFEENNTVYFYMDYIEGESLKSLVEKKGKLPLNTAIAYIQEVGNALTAVHEKGILHRDIKPDNIIINTRNNAILIDFGIARDFVEGETKTHTNMATKGYAPPEQFVQKAKRGAYTDVFSLGGTLYFCLTGQRPQTSSEISLDGFLTPKDLNKAIPNNINNAILKAIKPNPKERFQNIEAFLGEILGRNIIEEEKTFINSYETENTKIEELKLEDKRKSTKKPLPTWLYLLIGSIVVLAILVMTVLYFSNTNSNEDYEEETPDYNIEMVQIPGGTFQMGSNDGEDDEKPIHSVTVNDFYIGKYEVTNAEFAAFLNVKGNQEEGGTTWLEIESSNCLIEKSNGDFKARTRYENHPVIYVSWYGAKAYCRWLSETIQQNYRLPTEAEWEYAAKGGNKSNGYKYSGSDNVDEVAWYRGNSNPKIHSIGAKKANELGIYDMSGNVLEWCNDWYDTDYHNSSSNNPEEVSNGNSRVLRGGSWYHLSNNCRVVSRDYSNPYIRLDDFGFRVVRGD
jgi:formylglycine-generating enzyme required for sulfatase activity/predicted Ser/Thr protein kinase